MTSRPAKTFLCIGGPLNGQYMATGWGTGASTRPPEAVEYLPYNAATGLSATYRRRHGIPSMVFIHRGYLRARSERP